MKRFLLTSSLIILFFSCDKKEKYKGTWIFNDVTSVYDLDTPMKLIFTDDSIEIIRYDFKPSNKYAFQLEENNLVIENNLIKTEFNRDNLIINERLNFYKDDSGKKINEIGLIDPKIEINLPEIKTSNLIEYSKFLPSTYVRYGKRHDNGEFSLELNDKYSTFEDLAFFLSDSREDKNNHKYNFQKNYFYCDKNATMKDLEKAFIIMSSVNEKPILFVNKSKLQIKDSLAFNYKDEVLRTGLSSFFVKHNYVNSLFKNIKPRSFESHQQTLFYGTINDYPNVISLIKNEFYFNGIEIQKNELTKLLNEDIENKNHILSIYDLESDYYHFLELQIAIRSAYNSIRERKSLKEYKSPLNDLTKNQLDSIKAETPAKHIWSYSIPHYKAIVKDGYGFFGMKVKPLDSILPKN